MFLKIIAEPGERLQHHLRGFITDRAVRSVTDHLRAEPDPRKHIIFRVAVHDRADHFLDLFESCPAGRAFSAALRVRCPDEVQRHIDRAHAVRARGNSPCDILIKILENPLTLFGSFDFQSFHTDVLSEESQNVTVSVSGFRDRSASGI